MTDHKQRLQALAGYISKELTHLSEEIPKAVDQLNRSQSDVTKSLSDALAACTLPRSSAIYSDPLKRSRHILAAIGQANARADTLTQSARERAAALVQWSSRHAALFQSIDPKVGASPAEGALIRRWSAAVGLGPPLWTCYAAIPVLAFARVIDDLDAVNRTFLPATPGKRLDLGAGLRVLLDEGKDALFDVATAGGAIFIRASLSAMTPPLEPFTNELKEANDKIERVFRFDAALANVLAKAQDLAPLGDLAQLTIDDSFDTINREGDLVVDILTRYFGS